MTKEKRRGTIFWRQHATHKTTVVPFSLRARERPTVTVSLKWSRGSGVVNGKPDRNDLLMATDQVLDEVSERTSSPNPLVKQKQRIPDLKEMFE
jgi:bifunctional non-homologous end joining protein LigD